jgi:hypothetical protein
LFALIQLPFLRLRPGILAAGIYVAAVNLAIAAHMQEISGTRLPGSNVTEPEPMHSRYLETVNGGLIVIGKAVGFYLNTKVREKPATPLYITIEYPNPSGGPPATNDMDFLPTATDLQFSSPGAVRGIKMYADYQIVVRIFDHKGSDLPIDTLIQTIRAYIDTTGSQPRVFGKIRLYPQT